MSDTPEPRWGRDEDGNPLVPFTVEHIWTNAVRDWPVEKRLQLASRLSPDEAALRAFAQEIMECWPEGGLDGGDVQDTAVKHGLLVETLQPAPCGEHCDCAQYSDFPAICYRKTSLLTGK